MLKGNSRVFKNKGTQFPLELCPNLCTEDFATAHRTVVRVDYHYTLATKDDYNNTIFYNILRPLGRISSHALKPTSIRCRSFLVSGRNVRWPRRMLPPVSHGEYADGRDKRTDARRVQRNDLPMETSIASFG